MPDLKLVYFPEVYVITKQVVLWDNLRDFLDDHSFSGARIFDGQPRVDGDAIAEVAGRECYESWDNGRGHEEYIKNIVESKDGSILHHVVFGLLIAGVSRSFSFEWVRHKTGIKSDELDGTEDTDISQLSQRYVDSKDIRFVVPTEIQRVGGMALTDFTHSCLSSLNAYRDIAFSLEQDLEIMSLSGTDRRKRIRQAARSVLPNAAETRFFVTGNLRAFRNLLEQRTSPLADQEFRRVADAIGVALRPFAPQVFADYTVEDGTWTSPNTKI